MTPLISSRARRVAAGSLAATLATGLLAAASASPSPVSSSEGPDALFQATAVEEAASIRLSHLSTYESGIFDESAAEIVAFDPLTNQLFVVNAQSGAIDVLDLSDPTTPTLVTTLTMAGLPLADGSLVPAGASVNSVAVHGDYLAVATQAPDKVDPGWVIFLTTAGEPVTGVQIGSLPDMTAFSPDGNTLVVANEAEPADDFSSDPEGSVAVIDVSRLPDISQEDVRLARFTAYDEGLELPAGVRVFGPDVAVPQGQEPAGRVARNLEPEYVTVSADSTTAWASLQEANAIAEIDLASASVTQIFPVPTTDHSLPGFGLDPSDRDDAIAIANWPVTGLPQPDAIGTYSVAGVDYLVTANEGDAREWGDYEEGVRLGHDSYQLCEDAFGGPEQVAALKDPAALGRLNVTTASGLREGEDCYEQIFSFGSRSFSILDTQGNRIFDSGEMIESEIARLIEDGVLPEHAFNANHSKNPSVDTRSDDKGPEPEGLALGEIDGRTYLFLGLERIGGVMVFDLTSPSQARYVTYLNTRNWDAEYDDEEVPEMGDLGPEGLEFIPAQDSPSGRPMLAVGFEVSGTTSLFDLSSVAPERLAGTNRYETAVAISAGLEPGVERVYLASGQDFPDALAGSALAGSTDAAVLLTRADRLTAVTAAELERLQPGEIVLLGGPLALAPQIEEAASQVAPVRRVAGGDRYETAALIAAELEAGSTPVVYVASGLDFPDALTASAQAGAEGAPVLLTRQGTLPASIQQSLEALAPEQIVLLGGTTVIAEGVEEALAAIAPVERIAGENRYETAALLHAAHGGEQDIVHLATGEAFPDALSAAALAARLDSPLLLTRSDHLPAVTDLALRQQRPERLVLLGGPEAISSQVAQDSVVRLR